jgi:hypothetical protein
MVKVYGSKPTVTPQHAIGDIVGRLENTATKPSVLFGYVTGIRTSGECYGPNQGEYSHVEYTISGTDYGSWVHERHLLTPRQVIDEAHAHQRIWAECWDQVRQLGTEVFNGDISSD